MNIYKGNPINWTVDESLGDPVLEVAIRRYNKFLSQTFWSIADGLIACNAALKWAKRGKTSFRCFSYGAPVE